MAHGFFLNSHGFSAFDIGKNSSAQLLISSPDPVMDYFLFAGNVHSESDAAVISETF